MKRMMMILLGLAVYVLPAFAQWAQTAGPEGGTVYTLAAAGPSILATGRGGMLHRYSGTWTRMDGINPVTLSFMRGSYWASDMDKLYQSTTHGATWRATGLTGGPFMVARTTTKLFAMNEELLFKSPDMGVTWDTVGEIGGGMTPVELIGREDRLFLTTASDEGCELHISDDEGETWETIGSSTGATNFINSVEAANGTIMIALQEGGVLRSVDEEAWEEVNDGFTVGPDGPQVSQLLYADNAFWAACSDGVYRFDGTRWVKKNNDGDAILATVAGSPQGEILMGTVSGVYSGGSDGSTWEPLNDGLRMQTINDVATDGNGVLAATPGALFRTDDTGRTWEPIAEFGVRRVLEHAGALFVLPEYPFTHTLARSTNGGTTWEEVSGDIAGGMEAIGATTADAGALYVCMGTTVFAGEPVAGTNGVFRSTDQGETWHSLNNGLPRRGDSSWVPVSALFADGANLVGLAGDSVYYSMDGGASWKGSDLGIPTFYLPTWMVKVGGRIYLANDTRLFNSADNGATWTEEPVTAPNEGIIRHLTVVDDALVVLIESDVRKPLESQHLVFAKKDGTWRDISDRFTARIGHGMLHQVGPVLLSGTRGLSVWRANTAAVIGSHAAVEDARTLAFAMKASPNPFVADVKVNFTTESHGSVRLGVLNALGQEVKVAFNGMMQAGEHTVAIDAADLPAGVWYYRLTVNGRSETMKMVKDR